MRDVRRLLTVVSVLAVCAGCVQPKDPRVQVNALQADVVFGLPAKPKPVAPPGQPAPQVAETEVSAPEGPTNVTLPPISLPTVLTPLTKSACPAAALDAFPDQTAPIGIGGKPAVGEYLWQLGGDKAVGVNIVPVNGSERRLIRRVTPIAKAPTDNPDSVDYTFQQVEPYDTKGDVLELTYQVRSDNAAQRSVQPPFGTASAFVTTPDAGMSLVSEDVVTPGGGVTSLFHPVQPLLVLPLPIRPGAQFVSVAADAASGQVTILQASVVRRARVDACGTIIEGWEVIGIERNATAPTAAGPPGVPSNPLNALDLSAEIDNIYATQFGGMPIAEHTLQSSVVGTTSVDDAIGQERPSPLPAGAG